MQRRFWGASETIVPPFGNDLPTCWVADGHQVGSLEGVMPALSRHLLASLLVMCRCVNQSMNWYFSFFEVYLFS